MKIKNAKYILKVISNEIQNDFHLSEFKYKIGILHICISNRSILNKSHLCSDMIGCSEPDCNEST